MEDFRAFLKLAQSTYEAAEVAMEFQAKSGASNEEQVVREKLSELKKQLSMKLDPLNQNGPLDISKIQDLQQVFQDRGL